MRIAIDIPAEVIANMMISAIESGDPVTTAARGGWCNGINLRSRGADHDTWYAKPETYERPFVIEVIEVDDEASGHETHHRVRPTDMARGLQIMAAKYPGLFKQVLANDTDAPCADIFLQCIVFGEEKYA